jgi:CHAD domain-containing protein
LSDRFKQVGRGLGRVRDADIRIALLSALETRMPFAAASLAAIRRQRERERALVMRKLIKQVERIDVDNLLIEARRRSDRQYWPWTVVAGLWPRRLRRMLADRANTALESIHHGTGVYFPNRLHTTRIALKKLRYTAELGEWSGVGSLRKTIRELKQAQDILGDLHDRQVLINELPDAAARHPEIDPGHIRAAMQTLEAECRLLHDQYVAHRDRLVSLCEQTRSAFGERAVSGRAVAVCGAVALSSVCAWHLVASASGSSTRPIKIRIPIGGKTRVAG